MRPRIGLTALRSDITDSKYHILNDLYAQAILAAGGFPLVLPANPATVTEARKVCKGFLLVGGGDLDSALWQEELHPSAAAINPVRDAFEIELARQLLESKTPVLGICRGHQVMNVALGGTLWQDIPAFLPGSPNHDRKDLPDSIVHNVTIEGRTHLFQILKQRDLEVNSSHHQAVNELGRGFVISAASGDGIIEGIELPRHPFAIGVQWHPERLFRQYEVHGQLFKTFIAACRRPQKT